jgi:acyl carrier protein
MISAAEARKRAQENLTGFPLPVTESYLAFAETGNVEQLDRAVLGILDFYLAQRPAGPLTDLPGTTRLREDLGVDSLTMIDVLFQAEGLFDMKLADDELRAITTLDELRALFRQRLVRTEKPGP